MDRKALKFVQRGEGVWCEECCLRGTLECASASCTGGYFVQPDESTAQATAVEHTGLSVDYYKVAIKKPTSGGAEYTAECNDIIEALGMSYAEGNVFKALWRKCAARTLGKQKKGNTSLYDAEKIVFFGKRILEGEK